MGQLLKHSLPCQYCGSSDAGAEYTTNFYCYSCGKYILYDKEKSGNETNETIKIIPNYTPLSVEALHWLHSYGITDEEIKRYQILYTEHYWLWSKINQKEKDMGARVVFKYGDKDYDIEGRTLDKADKIKYVTTGDKTTLFKSGSLSDYPSETLVVVEDMLSAIKVGRLRPTVALRGTSVNNELLNAILNLSKSQIIIWLDGDEPGQCAARKLSDKLVPMRRVKIIDSKHDPKCYTTKIIKEFLKGSMNERN